LRRRWKSRLGVSTVVANMMMILITLSLAAILVAWAGTSYGALTGGSQLFFQQRGQALQERFVIENAFFFKSSNTLQIYVRNVGAIEVEIVAIYVNGTSLTPQTGTGRCSLYNPSLPPSPTNVPLVVQAVCVFALTVTPGNGVVQGDAVCGSTWCTSSMFYILVASGRGNQASYTARGS